MSWRIDLIKTHIEVENRHLMDEMLATLADDEPVRDEVAGTLYVGRTAVGERYAELWRAFPDFHVEPTGFIAQGSRVVMEAMYSGTHLGPYLGHGPTRRSFEIRLANVFELDYGFGTPKILRETIYIDLASQLRQLQLLRLAA